MADNETTTLKEQIDSLLNTTDDDMAKVWLNSETTPDMGTELKTEAEQKPAPEPEKKEETGEQPTEQNAGPKVYNTLEEFVADGNDPDYFQGKKAFEISQDEIQKAKQYKSERNETNEMLSQIQQTQAKQEERHQLELVSQRATLEEKSNLAETEEDLPAYKLAQNELQSMPPKEERAPVEPQEPVEYRNLRASDSKLNRDSTDFDPLYNAAFEQSINHLAQKKQNSEQRVLYGHERQEIIDTVKLQMKNSQHNQPKTEPNPNRLRPAPVSTPNGATVKTDPMGKMSVEHKLLYDTWSKGSDYQKDMAKSMLEKYK